MNRCSYPTPGWAVVGLAMALFYGIGRLAFLETPAEPKRVDPAYFSASGKLVRTGLSPAAR
jgi:hypothetical protein